MPTKKIKLTNTSRQRRDILLDKGKNGIDVLILKAGASAEITEKEVTDQLTEMLAAPKVFGVTAEDVAKSGRKSEKADEEDE